MKRKRGYREFVYQYESTFIEDTSSITKGTRLILNSYQELLNKVYSLVDEEQIARIARYLGEATRVLVCGKGSSGHAAEEMELRFMRIGVNIDSLRDSDLIRMQAIFQSKQNLVFGITISGEAEDVLFLLREARRRGAKTVLITAHNNDQFYEFCSEIVLMPSLKYLNQGNVISPQFPILLMLDLIYACYSGLDKGIKERMHGNTLRTLSAGIKKSKGRE